ncbi:MAG TPA: LysR family transcriptional regulator [Dokdonella sp.]|uniref:LysR family transcriptional regulator n=1 Tax=Dokdonella sp. TaxID=2291710 RepID=UPI0025B98A9F|nr:LysR family transcriptional regulator [Dokdonella sp.]MBX3693101.1 LysR family transcriptional regulator [Dokdonella sp.]MCW5567831.1 LysR family transcriptional regulator [Dokdonella sp.]HNR91368.1 LysR family transcriptional regulator [Dokdonella sp.]
MDRLQAIEVFVRVVDAGNFTRAADSLRMPRSSVSTIVQRFESYLGVRLLQRTTRRMQLTDEGIACHAWCQRLLADIDEGESRFRGTGMRPRGRLRVDVPNRIARRVIAPALPGFFAEFPDIELELRSSDRAVDLVEEGVDLAIRVGELRDSRLAARPLGHLRMMNLASPGYLARHGLPQVPADLDRHFAIHYASPTSGRIEEWEYVEDGVVLTKPMQARVTVNNVETYVACCLAGLGLIQIPAYDAREHLSDGSLVEVLSAWPAAAMPLSALYPHRRHLSPRVTAFLDWLVPLFEAGFQPQHPV